MLKSRKAAIEKSSDVLFMAFILVFAFTGVTIFGAKLSADQLETFLTEKTLYINHIFSKSICLAYQKNGIVMPYFVDFDKIKDGTDLKGCLNLDKEDSPFAMKIVLAPSKYQLSSHPELKKVLYYDKSAFEKWSLFAEEESERGKRVNLYFIKSYRLVTLITHGKEIEGLAIIYSIFPK